MGSKNNSQVIEETKDNTKDHVCNAKNNRHLHFQRVCECQFVCRKLPDLDVEVKQNENIQYSIQKRNKIF